MYLFLAALILSSPVEKPIGKVFNMEVINLSSNDINIEQMKRIASMTVIAYLNHIKTTDRRIIKEFKHYVNKIYIRDSVQGTKENCIGGNLKACRGIYYPHFDYSVCYTGWCTGIIDPKAKTIDFVYERCMPYSSFIHELLHLLEFTRGGKGHPTDIFKMKCETTYCVMGALETRIKKRAARIFCGER